MGPSDPTRERLRTLDRRHVWHPYTQMRDYEQRDPVIVANAEGVRVQDVDGRWYYDGISSVWLNVHGHRVKALDDALRAQLGRVAHTTLLGQANVESIELAARLAKVAPKGLARVFFSDNGSTAVEAALKMALQYWHARGRKEKRLVASFEGGYHGDTLGAVGIAPVPTFHAPFLGVVTPSLQAPYPDCYRAGCNGRTCTASHLAPVEAMLRKHGKNLAAFFVEPMVQGVGGVRVMPRGFLKGLRRLCTEHEVLLVADEVATGFGRTGRMWAVDHERVSPDLLAMGKGLTGGYLPLAATLATEEIYSAFLGTYAQKKTFFHGHSFTGNQLGCAVALANLDLMPDVLRNLPARIRLFADGLANLADHPFVGDVRTIGLLGGVELVADKETKTGFPWEAAAPWKVADRARGLGLLTRPIGPVGLLVPPLATPLEDLRRMLDLFSLAHLDSTPALAQIARRNVPALAR